MEDAGLDTAAFQQLNAGQRQLLDTIDNLRQLGVGSIVDLPQIIVVGDQSSGKSSVLEAISRVRFPINSGLCTRFATELVLRKAPQVQIEAKIIPADKSGTPSAAGDGAVLTEFHEKSFSHDALPDMIEKAKKVMGIGTSFGQANFSEDILRIEISGPDTPPLTLVDLPGIYHSSTAAQSAEGKDVVKRLMRKYMRQQNTIILAVVSARSELELQEVLEEAQQKDCDPKRARTLGIITKPDNLRANSADERVFIDLARNKEPKHRLKLGWHVLRNRSQEERDVSDAERDLNEQNFFLSSGWQGVSARDRGIEALRRKLSRVLVGHIEKSMPDMVRKIEEALKERQKKLDDLGPSRSSPSELRLYLTDIARKFERLAEDSIRGSYTDTFFGDLFPAGDTSAAEENRKLRAIVRDLNRTFTGALVLRGHAQTIEWTGSTRAKASYKTRVCQSLAPEWWLPYQDFSNPSVVTIGKFCADLKPTAAANQGRELPGSPNQELVVRLFRDQSKRWGPIAHRHVELALNRANMFAEELVSHTVGLHDQRTRTSILTELVDPFFAQVKEVLALKVNELVFSYQSGYTEVIDARYQQWLSGSSQQRLARRIAESWPGANEKISCSTQEELEALTKKILQEQELPGSEFGTALVVDNMEILYDLSLITFTQNVISLAVENCLMQKIPEIFTTNQVASMSDDKLRELAAESEDLAIERDECKQQVAALRAGLEDCRKHAPREPKGPVVTVSMDKERQPSTTSIGGHERPRTPSSNSISASTTPVSSSSSSLFTSSPAQASVSTSPSRSFNGAPAATTSQAQPSSQSALFSFASKPAFGASNGSHHGISGSGFAAFKTSTPTSPSPQAATTNPTQGLFAQGNAFGNGGSLFYRRPVKVRLPPACGQPDS